MHTSRKVILLLAILLGVTALSACMPGFSPPFLPGFRASPESESAPAVINVPGVPSAAIPLYAEKCSACHGPAGGGTDIAPPLNSAELRARLDDDALQQTIRDGRPGTAMPVWGRTLSEEQIASLVALIRNWDSFDEVQLEALASQSGDCGAGMGMHHGMGPMMGGGCGGMGGP